MGIFMIKHRTERVSCEPKLVYRSFLTSRFCALSCLAFSSSAVSQDSIVSGLGGVNHKGYGQAFGNTQDFDVSLTGVIAEAQAGRWLDGGGTDSANTPKAAFPWHGLGLVTGTFFLGLFVAEWGADDHCKNDSGGSANADTDCQSGNKPPTFSFYRSLDTSFSDPVDFIGIPMNAPSGFAVAHVAGDDGDFNALTVELDGSDSPFRFNSVTNKLWLPSAAALEPNQTYFLTFKATDGELYTNNVLRITVGDTNVSFLDGTTLTAEGDESFSIATGFPTGPDYSFALADGSSMPRGLILDQHTGKITGNIDLIDEKTAEVFSFTATATTADEVLSNDFTVHMALNLTSLSNDPSNIIGGGGDDQIRYDGSDLYVNAGPATIDLGAGDNILDLGNYEESYGTLNLAITANHGADQLTLGRYAARQKSQKITASLGDGENRITIGQEAATNGASMSINTGKDNDVISVGQFGGAGEGSEFSVKSGGGDDLILIGDKAGYAKGRFDLQAGEGADIVTFGARAASNEGDVKIDLGAGADQLVMGTDLGSSSTAQMSPGTTNVDVGSDDDRDVVIFLGSVLGAALTNLEIGDQVAFASTAVNAGRGVLANTAGNFDAVADQLLGSLVQVDPELNFNLNRGEMLSYIDGNGTTSSGTFDIFVVSDL